MRAEGEERSRRRRFSGSRSAILSKRDLSPEIRKLLRGRVTLAWALLLYVYAYICICIYTCRQGISHGVTLDVYMLKGILC